MDGGNRGNTGRAVDFEALNKSQTTQEMKKALGQVAVGYAVDLSKDEIDKDTYKELKDVMASFEKKNEVSGEKYVDLYGMANRRNEIMTESLDKNWNRQFGGAAVEANDTEVMDFTQLANEQDGAVDQGGEQAV